MPPTATMVNYRFWLYTASLLLVWLIVISTASPLEQNTLSVAKLWGKTPVQQLGLEKSCQALCGQCGCMGFYCGEECLCEYDKHRSLHRGTQKRNSTKTRTATNYECIATMQRNAQTQSLPFEVLIQGPSSERFMRTAMEFELDAARTAATLAIAPQRRTTISIYRPYAHMQSNKLQQGNESAKNLKSAAVRPRRSTDHLDWFSDFANTLVRPAPLRKSADSGTGSNKKRETQSDEDDSTAEEPNSWFSDHTNRLLRPAPFFRSQKSQKSLDEEDEGSDEVRDSQEVSMPPVGQVIKNTIRNIQESEIGEGLRAGLRDGTEILQNNLELFPKRFRNDFVEVFDSWLKSQQATEASLEVPVVPPRAAPPVFLPWFRPVRFLQRVQQALN